MPNMKQTMLAMMNSGFELHGKTTKRAAFLARMETLVPWAGFCALIEPYYPKAGNRRPPVGVEPLLRMYFIANGFNMADEACEDALHDIPVLREFFARLTLGASAYRMPQPCLDLDTCSKNTTWEPPCSPRCVNCCCAMG